MLSVCVLKATQETESRQYVHDMTALLSTWRIKEPKGGEKLCQVVVNIDEVSWMKWQVSIGIRQMVPQLPEGKASSL